MFYSLFNSVSLINKLYDSRSFSVFSIYRSGKFGKKTTVSIEIYQISFSGKEKSFEGVCCNICPEQWFVHFPASSFKGTFSITIVENPDLNSQTCFTLKLRTEADKKELTFLLNINQSRAVTNRL